MDFGHTFLRVDDYGTRTSVYLDPWRDSTGASSIIDTESGARLEDYHAITWEVVAATVEQAIEIFEEIKTSGTGSLTVFHNNCAEMTIAVLNELGYTVEAPKSHLLGVQMVMPASVGPALEGYLTSVDIPYSADVEVRADSPDSSTGKPQSG